jgi:hypothetical protein
MAMKIMAGVLAATVAGAVMAQGAVPAPAAGAVAAPVVGAESKDAPGTASVQDQMSGKRSSRAVKFDHKAPMNVRIKDDGVKMPRCAAESREGEACK